MPEIRTHADVKAAAKDWRAFSSDLQGDPDVRDYRQLPLEADPPAHRAYRDLLEPYFGRVEVARMEPAFRAIAEELVEAFAAAGGGDAVHALAFPMVLRGLAVAFDRPDDIPEWASWGLETWVTRPDGTRSGDALHAYLDRVLAEAATRPDAAGDIWQRIAAARLGDRALTAVEQRGLAGLVLAGGRDTVIKLISGACWHLASAPEAYAALRADASRIPAAIEEYLRFLSPLPRMEREARAGATVDGAPVAPGTRVHLSFLAANHDPARFDAPDTVQLDRSPNHHVAFGNGPHTCVGAHLARVETRCLLEALVARVALLAPAGEPAVAWTDVGGARVPGAFTHLPLRAG